MEIPHQVSDSSPRWAATAAAAFCLLSSHAKYPTPEVFDVLAGGCKQRDQRVSENGYNVGEK